MICEKCGVEMENSEKVCRNCGALQKGAKFCQHCGEAIDVDCIICPKCGKQVQQLKQEQPQVVINNTNTNTVTSTATATANGARAGQAKTSGWPCACAFFSACWGPTNSMRAKSGWEYSTCLPADCLELAW